MFDINNISFASFKLFSKEDAIKILAPFMNAKSDLSKEGIFIVGEKASGKTNFIANFYSRGGCDFKFLNVDILAGIKNINNYTARNLIQQKYKECLQNGESFVFEMQLSTLNEIELLKLAKSKGYNITLIYITTNNLSINIERLQKNKDINEIELQNLILKYENTRNNINAIKNLCDKYFLFDNSKNK